MGFGSWVELWQVAALLYLVVGVVLSPRWSVSSCLLLAGGMRVVRLWWCAWGVCCSRIVGKGHRESAGGPPFREHGIGQKFHRSTFPVSGASGSCGRPLEWSADYPVDPRMSWLQSRCRSTPSRGRTSSAGLQWWPCRWLLRRGSLRRKFKGGENSRPLGAFQVWKKFRWKHHFLTTSRTNCEWLPTFLSNGFVVGLNGA